MVQSVAVSCYVLRCVVVWCVSWCDTVGCRTQHRHRLPKVLLSVGKPLHMIPKNHVCCSVLQCVAVRWGAIQSVAVSRCTQFSKVACVAVCCSVLWCDAMCCRESLHTILRCKLFYMGNSTSLPSLESPFLSRWGSRCRKFSGKSSVGIIYGKFSSELTLRERETERERRTHTHTQTHLYIYVYIHIYKNMYMHKYIHIYHIYIHIWYIYMCKYMYTYICTYQYIYVCMNICKFK